MIGSYTKKIDFEYIKDLPNQGANSLVFLGRDKQLNHDLVYKKIRRDSMNPIDYFKEASLIYANRHQYVVSVNYGCYDDEFVYIGMPYYKNGSIKDKITNGKSLSPREAVRYAIQFSTGLNHIHSKGLIHFDIKPDNILISDSDEALISDFGLSKSMVAGKARPDKIYKLHYTPEYLKGLDSDIRSDIYQVGLTLYRMLNGYGFLLEQAKKELTANDIISGKFPNRNIYLAHVPLSLRKIVNKCLAANPVDRYQNMLDLINDLSKIPNTPNLDWRFTQTSTSDTWTRAKDDVTDYTVSVVKSLNYSIFTSKSGRIREQKISKYCFNNISKEDKDKQLKSILNKL